MAEIIRAETAGFCMGVDLALRKLDEVVNEYGDVAQICTLGPIIHNPQVLDYYTNKGVLQVNSLKEIPRKSHVLIRAHGVAKKTQKVLEDMDAQIIDATCPKVKKAQMLIAGESNKGRILLLLGERDHPEVSGLLSYASSKAIVFESLSEIHNVNLNQSISYFLAAQTTQNRNEYNSVVQYLRNRIAKDIPVFDTICDTTKQRQEEALRIANKVEIMVVVGGHNSGNTRRLAQVVRQEGISSIHIEQAEELPLQILKNKKKIGLTAGASTPGYIIDSVQQTLQSLDC